jgi:prepilin-type N-terminal cleavage/methylation domain-containing protein
MPAFTLVEVLVTMILISIIISASSYLLLSFEKINNNYKNNSDSLTAMNNLFYSLNQDINSCEEMYIKNGKIYFQNSKMDTIVYQFGKKFVLQSYNNVTDTIRLSFYSVIPSMIVGLHYHFLNIEIQNFNGTEFTLCFYAINYPTKFVNSIQQ